MTDERTEFQPGPATDHYHSTLGVAETEGGILRSHTVTLTDAQIRSLTTAIEIVPAPGAGIGIDLLRIQLVAFIPDGREYTNLSASSYLIVRLGSIEWAYANNNGTYLGQDNLHDLFEVPSTSSNTLFFGPFYDIGNPDIGPQPSQEYRGADLDDQPLSLLINNALGNLQGGHEDNTMRVTTIYSLVDLAP